MIFCQQNCKPIRICTFQEKLENLTGANTRKKMYDKRFFITDSKEKQFYV